MIEFVTKDFTYILIAVFFKRIDFRTAYKFIKQQLNFTNIISKHCVKSRQTHFFLLS